MGSWQVSAWLSISSTLHLLLLLHAIAVLQACWRDWPVGLQTSSFQPTHWKSAWVRMASRKSCPLVQPPLFMRAEWGGKLLQSRPSRCLEI
jgi:hypothetical protein